MFIYCCNATTAVDGNGMVELTAYQWLIFLHGTLIGTKKKNENWPTV